MMENYEDQRYVEETKSFIKRLESKSSKVLKKYMMVLGPKSTLEYIGIILFDSERATKYCLTKDILKKRLKEKSNSQLLKLINSNEKYSEEKMDSILKNINVPWKKSD